MARYIKGQSDCQNAIPCGRILRVTYDWTMTAVSDLDTGTSFLTEKAGWSCSPYGTYVRFVTGDSTAMNSREIVEIEVERAMNAGLWTSSVVINCFAHWYPSGSTKSGTVILRAKTIKGILCTDESAEQTKNLFIAVRGSSCSINPVGTITYNADGSFTLV
jgi:hypothetical protein